MTAISTGWQSALTTWRSGPAPAPWDQLQWAYAERWLLYSGQLFEAMTRDHPYFSNPAIYNNTRLLWKHHEAVVDFYAGVIYQGMLSDEPGEGAIPWELDVDGEALTSDGDPNDDTPAGRLWRAVLGFQAAWNWQQQMSLRPMYGAALADCLTELVDDTDRRFTYPQVVWPGYVKDVEIDYVGNVRRYVLEYRTQERNPDGTLGESYLYRKEVDGDAFRHYRNDTLTRTVPNPYGFVPAIWDRHRIAAPGAVRGKAAADGTRQVVLQLNSLFSHAFDFQHKAFWVPFMVAGNHTASRQGGSQSIDLGTPPAGIDAAELYKWIKVPEGSNLLQPEFDVGKTQEMIADLREGILAENPEASFYQQMREMQQVTAPGAERLMGDVKNRVDLARAGYDANTVKLFQMAIAIAGFRARDRGPEGWTAKGMRLDRRRLAFAPFDLESYARGELDLRITARPIITPTELEELEAKQRRLDVIASAERLQTEWGLIESGEFSKKEAKALISARTEQAVAVQRFLDRGDLDPVPEVVE